FRVDILLSADSFTIKDNCGGIPTPILRDYAFKLGRDPNDPRDPHETIGMYGIGMKRAIFKMGRSATVQTQHAEQDSRGVIDASWLDDPEWHNLSLTSVSAAERLPTTGTSITVTNLREGISARFQSVDFQDELAKALADHFTLFLQRGFDISLNG